MSASLPLPTPRTIGRHPRSNAATQPISRRRLGRVSARLARLRTGLGPRRAGTAASIAGSPGDSRSEPGATRPLRDARPLGTARPLGAARPFTGSPDAASSQLGAAPPRRRWNTQLIKQLARFAAVGVISTVAQLGLFLLLRDHVGALSANLISLVLSTLANTEANRRFTFGIRGRAGAARQQLLALGVFGLSLALSSGALALLALVAPTAGPSAEVVVLVAANALATVARFAMLRTWVFGARPSA